MLRTERLKPCRRECLLRRKLRRRCLLRDDDELRGDIMSPSNGEVDRDEGRESIEVEEGNGCDDGAAAAECECEWEYMLEGCLAAGDNRCGWAWVA